MKKQKVTYDETSGVVKVEYPTIRKAVQVALGSLAQDVLKYAAVHGLKQRLGDAESGGSPAEKYEMAKRIVESLEGGSWDITTRTDDGGIVIEAVSRLKKRKVEDIRKVIEELGEDGPDRIKEWRSNAKVKAEIAKIRAERAAKAADEADEDDEITLD